jgi:hypothetical protein
MIDSVLSITMATASGISMKAVGQRALDLAPPVQSVSIEQCKVMMNYRRP